MDYIIHSEVLAKATQPQTDSTREDSLNQTTNSSATNANVSYRIMKPLPQSSSAPSYWPFLALIVVIMCLGVIIFIIKKTDRRLKGEIGKIRKELGGYKKKIEDMATAKESICQRLDSLECSKNKDYSKEPTVGNNNKCQDSHIANDRHSNNSQIIDNYADFFTDGGVAIVENRDLGNDKNNGNFIVRRKDGAQDAIYTINDNKIDSILQDISVLLPFVDEFQKIPNATSIKVIKEGHLSRERNLWKVTKKLKIKLI